MFDLDIEDNITLTLEVSETYLKNIIADPQNVKNYKMLILTLHNALELTFKFMLQSRNDFMIYEMQSSGSYNKVMETYKNARKNRKHQTEAMPSQKVLHTISFTKAYEMLAYLYNEEAFDEKFIFKLNRLGSLRNALTHHKGRIEHTDILVLYQLYEECVELYNSELDHERNAFNRLLHEDDSYGKMIIDRDLSYEFSKAIKEIKMKLLDEPMVKELISHLIKTLGNINPDIDLNEYEELYEFFYKKQPSLAENGYDLQLEKLKEFSFTESEIAQFQESINRKNQKIKQTNKNNKELALKYIYMLLEADFIYSRTYYSNDIDIMGGISLSVSCKHLILDKWDRNSEIICKEFKLSHDEYMNLIHFDGDHTSDGYDEYEISER